MELVQNKITGEFTIKADGFFATNSEEYFNATDSIADWVLYGTLLTDGKVVKSEVKRIVNLESGVNLDAKLLNLENDEIILIAGKELLFELVQSTMVPNYMTLVEYDNARLYRQSKSAQARSSRWESMLKSFADPSVLSNQGKVAFLSEELKKYKEDYVTTDNKVLESFIAGQDHPLAPVPGYRDGELDFSTPGKGLDTLALWDNPVLGGADAGYKTKVKGIIEDHIIKAKHYITE